MVVFVIGMNRRRLWLVTAVVVLGLVPSANQASAGAARCLESGVDCSVGSVGPGGGIVFYDAGSMQWWGRFLEAKPDRVAATAWGTDTSVYLESRVDGIGGVTIAQQRQRAKQIGMGKTNTALMTNKLLSPALQVAGWFVPSKDELNALFDSWKINGLRRTWGAQPMWTSTEASNSFAWHQLFQDGTQFTDANGIIPLKTGNKSDTLSQVHVGSNFVASPFRVIPVRAFPLSTGVAPPPAFVPTTARVNAACSQNQTSCAVGDIGPGGGLVFFDAGKSMSWGRYLEVAPQSCEGVGLPWRVGTARVYKSWDTAAKMRLAAKQVGMGRANTQIITQSFGSGTYAAQFAQDLLCNGQDDWFLPSKDELDLAYNNLAQNRDGGQDTPLGGFNKGYYWTSTDYNNTTAWTEYFMDGQQFDRVQTLLGNMKPPANPFRVRSIRAFG
ncbi:MAG: DUF1566 domain-containing protein [Actinobacteria bacterium]|nr:MAG: DUF1566 domain-containing protein [Actinomycetota bacterium]